MTLLKDAGHGVREANITRSDLYYADEIFFTGTAAEVTPVRSVDGIPVGDGKAGPVSKALQRHFLETVRGENEDPHGWLTYVAS